jgi:hypothetical protein
MTCKQIRLYVTSAIAARPFWSRGAVPLCSRKCPLWEDGHPWNLCKFGRGYVTYSWVVGSAPCRPATSLISKLLQRKGQ